MFKSLIRPQYFTGLQPRYFSTTIRLNQFKDWKSLSKNDKQQFITNYVELFQKKHPCSKGNVMNKQLAEGMHEYDDTPYVFGIIYNEIRSIALGEPNDNEGEGVLNDKEFASLLYK